MLELNYFLFTGTGSRCPSSHVQGFEGNSVSITKHRQPTQTHEERLGHPPNQCPRELTRPIPARACPGNVAHPSTYMHRCTLIHTHTHTTLTTSKKILFAWYDNLVGPCCPELPLRGSQTWALCLQQNASYLQHFAKGQGSFFRCIIYLLFQGAVCTNVTCHYLEVERNLKRSPSQLFLGCLLRYYAPFILAQGHTRPNSFASILWSGLSVGGWRRTSNTRDRSEVDPFSAYSTFFLAECPVHAICMYYIESGHIRRDVSGL